MVVLDANDSMTAVYDEDNGTTGTRFDCAKRVAQDMIADLIIRSKTNEASVIVLKTKKTHHHFTHHNIADKEDDMEDDEEEDDDGINVRYPNISEMGGDGITTDVSRPTPEILCRIHKLKATTNSRGLRGDFCDGIIMAADSLYQRTASKKYQRRIVLITDAEHRVEVDHQQLLLVLDSLRAMECRLEVIGFDFEQQAEYDFAASAATAKVKQEEVDAKDEIVDDDSATDVSSNASEGNEDNKKEKEDADDEEIRLLVKRQNEQLLISLTEKTGGYVMAAKELQAILQKVVGHRISKSTRSKFILKIAPGLEFDARFSKLLSRASKPPLAKQVAMTDEQGRARINALGEEMTEPYQTILSHWDPENEEEEVTEIAKAYKYGSDIIPMGGFDQSGLITISEVKMVILCYLPLHKVPPELRIGPPYAISGADSLRTCAAISAMATALRQKELVAIATFVKRKNTDPILVGIFPLKEGDKSTHLVFLQLPFQDDIPTRILPSFEPSKDATKENVCDDLIDSLMLDSDALDYTRIPNPRIRSFHQTVVSRVIDPKLPVIPARPEEDDPMATPRNVLEHARPALQAFRKTFPLTKNLSTNAKDTNADKRKKGPANYRDFLDED